ncbi:uncharacterized protein DNG_07590 [Cephalotrichum gorgonifer]|uniref:Uncharacterized protein n=1 Tax=Cephalotrichum gorgonifer TaxID=2041049 RepID=A0AAE8SXJ9_9PEZI|nr:uncharacterized protein DNG_07590 [Cephalotrichum gorgonifer]
MKPPAARPAPYQYLSTTPPKPPPTSPSSSTSPLSQHYPPQPPPPPSSPPILHPYPTAVIHYRWSPALSDPADDLSTPLRWPTPLHDVSFAYAHLTRTLCPPHPSRRPIYLLSSHLGASLATSLALTESRPHVPFAVRGLAVYNGVYNWTMFLPDHRVHRASPKKTKAKKSTKPRRRNSGGEDGDDSHGGGACAAMRHLESSIPDLFPRAAHLFDPFASPSLFFRTAGLDVPSSFTRSEALASQIDRLASASSLSAEASGADDDLTLASPPPPAPRRAALVFPPRHTTLRIPETHLLYTTTGRGSGRRRSAAKRGNTFEAQALELAELMRRSVEREVRERSQWDDDVGDDVPAQRVKAWDLGDEDFGVEGGAAEETLSRWLEEKFGF